MKSKLSARIRQLKQGDEIGGEIIKYAAFMYDKGHNDLAVFATLNKKGHYSIHRSDSSGILYDTGEKYLNLKSAILQVIEITKSEARLKHNFKLR